MRASSCSGTEVCSCILQGAAHKLRPGKPAAAQPRSVAGILSHESLELQQQRAARRASSGISWAAELQLQEPEDDNARDHMGAHMGSHLGFNTGDHLGSHSQTPPGHASMQDLAAQGLQPETNQWQHREAAMDPSAAPVQAMGTQREGLNAYYWDKAAAEQAAYADARLYAQQIEQQNSYQQQQQMVSGIAVHAPVGVDFVSEAEVGTVVCGDSVLERLRGVKALSASLALPSYGSVSLQQSEVDALSPGLPGLQSQLSKMMQEVSQARNEVQGLRSELDHSTLQSQKSGSFSLAGYKAEQ